MELGRTMVSEKAPPDGSYCPRHSVLMATMGEDARPCELDMLI